MGDELVGRQRDLVGVAPGEAAPAGFEVGHVALGGGARQRHQGTGIEEKAVRHLGVGAAQEDQPARRQRVRGPHGGSQAGAKLRMQDHVVLEHHDAARAARAGEPPRLQMLQGQRHLLAHGRAGGEMSLDRRVVELGRIEIENELERDAETFELAAHMRDALGEALDRQHEDGVDRELAERGRHHALRPARSRGGGAHTGAITWSISTARAKAMPSVVMAQR